jgi:enoyl-CoA hydratase/carnithine racemase
MRMPANLPTTRAAAVGETAAVIDLTRDGDVRILTMDDGENRFDLASVAALHAALDEVEAVEGPCALVTTGTGKFFSNGLDLDWMMGGGEVPRDFVDDVHRLFGRVLALDVHTVAAVNGHAFAGGAMLAAAHDTIVMRVDRGFWCVNEVDLGLPFSPAMFATLETKLPKATLTDASLTGRRFGGEEAVAAGIATEAVPEAAVLPRAIEVAASMTGKNRDVIRAHKRYLRGAAIDTCFAPVDRG